METILMNTEHSKKPTQKKHSKNNNNKKYKKKKKRKKETKSFPFTTDRKIYDNNT